MSSTKIISTASSSSQLCAWVFFLNFRKLRFFTSPHLYILGEAGLEFKGIGKATLYSGDT